MRKKIGILEPGRASLLQASECYEPDEGKMPESILESRSINTENSG